jgi:putative transposase
VIIGRNAQPSVGIIDSQVLRAKEHTADIQDRAAVPLLLEGADGQFPRVEHLWVDQGYTGSGKTWIEENLRWRVEVVRHPPHPRGEWVPHGDLQDWRTIWFSWQRLPSAPKVFRGVLPRRWVVERTFAWLCQNRRFSRIYERLCVTGEALIYAAMGRLMLRRLAKRDFSDSFSTDSGTSQRRGRDRLRHTPARKLSGSVTAALDVHVQVAQGRSAFG